MAKQKSDLSRAFSEDGAVKTHVGGQALIEGVMMRGKYNWAVAVREPNGSIYVEEHDLKSGKDKNGWMYWPLVRGCRALVESLMLGFKALEIAALHAFGDEEGEQKAAAEADFVEAEAELEGAAAVAAEEARVSEGGLKPAPAEVQGGVKAAPAEVREGEERAGFSWKRDFGHPDEMVDGLGAQRTLEVVSEADAPARPRVGAQGGASTTPEDNPGNDPVGGDLGRPSAAKGGDVGKRDVSSGKDEAAEEEFGHREMVFSMVVGLVLGVVLFIVAPAAVTNLIVGEYDDHTLAWNIVDGLLRVAVFVFYIWLIGRMEDIKRMFMYHGAEHKAIHCFEHGLPMTPENARQFPRLHVRCGTAFLIMVMVIAILVYTIFPLNAIISGFGVPDGLPKLILVIVARIVLMPVIAGISYEITVKWAGSHPDNPLVKVILWPGMQMQYLTTNEPDDAQMECAIAAMRTVLDREEAEKAKAAAAPAASPAA
ncbi:DUF1385 domain-containing protein [Adlercreutzia sp. R21]|uniref:DUF1385 domain-containing protein n=1 Tax=Adlercreutzia wanghongyangiae TaxID=3111451 RepID=UPI002DB8811D|nr:DUF1385 domain-containing protein [Adlercreutzia sp. R21]MEC4184963.1 DUF1385 domain-containing protein [Adlercreutzia sp. R21]